MGKIIKIKNESFIGGKDYIVGENVDFHNREVAVMMIDQATPKKSTEEAAVVYEVWVKDLHPKTRDPEGTPWIYMKAPTSVYSAFFDKRD
jgi:hypothetical protein